MTNKTTWRVGVTALSVAAVAAAVLGSPAAASVPTRADETTDHDPQTRGDRRPPLTLSANAATIRQGQSVTFSGRTSPATPGITVILQAASAGSVRSGSWTRVASVATAADGTYSLRLSPTEGARRYRVSAPGPGWISAPVPLLVLPPYVDLIVQPRDQETVATTTKAIRGAQSSVDIVVYNQGAQDIALALQAAKARLARNHPATPAIRVMVNGQWNGQSKNYWASLYVQRMMSLLGVNPTTGRSADGVVQFNYSATNFSLTHQKTLIIDARKPDGSEYASAQGLPEAARAIVATFNLQAFGWSDTFATPTPGAGCGLDKSTGIVHNPTCNFVNGTPGTRDLGVILRRPSEVWTIERIFSSDFAGPKPTEINLRYGLDDPRRTLVWSNGTVGVAAPPPTGFGKIFSQSPTSFPARAGSKVGSGFYPYPFYLWVQDAAASPAEIRTGKVAGNANAVHLNIINAAKTAAQHGRPAALYIYNEEYADTAVTTAITQAAQAGVVVRIVMTFSSTTNTVNNYQSLVSATRPGGAPVNAQVHLYPSTADYLYIHAKMIYADLDSDQVFIGSQNFSENSLLQNRELGVHLRQSDGTLPTPVKAKLLSTFRADNAATGADQPACPIVVLSPTNTWLAQKAGLDSNTGCKKSAPSQPNPGIEAQLVTPAYPAPSTFPAPLQDVQNEYNPPLPQGPITTNVAPAPVFVCSNGAWVATAGECNP